MNSAGLDAGSTWIKLVILNEKKEVIHRKKLETALDAQSRLRSLFDEVARFEVGSLVATGYGRKLALKVFSNVPKKATVSEIQAHAAGALFLFPEARSVLDIGGQDTKAIVLGPEKRPSRFEMNDRCAAGTGKFLEITARAFGKNLDDFGLFALKGDSPPEITSTCAVFAESEIISLTARGERPENIAKAIHLSVAKRTVAMLRRVGFGSPLVFSGGVARNPCMVRLLRDFLKDCEILTPEKPEFTGALGAALLAVNNPF
ncbi:acyl-CoA dehydratase activase [Thermodesulforhabdus norvegica]|uniref:CoA-substrate-specific enzyme activase, putative n=1 Tax=Thermodesulforhabdus norvegica TaxID=39841 RepID=A0A1I4RK79_9BACT|nr:acyl-CoA dehydratase activase [Thermodesulforhabdus norvegica]SFM52662.1 CoA-substrate-specific enzyme activase, putative [Thermodesulforhabdus norvegica]